MPFLAVRVETDPKVPAGTTGRVLAQWSWSSQPPSLPVLPLLILPVPVKPLSNHLAGWPPRGQTLKPRQRHPGPAALHPVAVTSAANRVNCNTFLYTD